MPDPLTLTLYPKGARESFMGISINFQRLRERPQTGDSPLAPLGERVRVRGYKAPTIPTSFNGIPLSMDVAWT